MPTFLLEVGTEELPAAFVSSAIAQWQTLIPVALAEQMLVPESVRVYGTPRRLSVLAFGVPAGQRDREEDVKGPPARAAFQDGQPTKAAAGFARKQGVEVADLEVRPTEKGDFVFARKVVKGRSSAELLAEFVPQWIDQLEGKRFMCWGDGTLRFSRPIRWLVALLDDAVLPVTLKNGSETIAAGRVSYGHRVLSPQALEIPRAQVYLDVLAAAQIEVDPERRRKAVANGIRAQAAALGGHAELYPDLLEEVTALVETPSAIAGEFDPAFLQLPDEVATTEMIEHQRYFPVWKDEKQEELLPYFIAVSNGDPAKADIIAAGNARVLRARLADGQFFFDQDRKQPLADFLPKLETVTFQAQLGSVRDKVERIRAIAAWIGEQLDLDAEERQLVDRAAELCKADLVTQMVGEFPELQGIIGTKYARASGEPEAVAVAIAEHYLPRGAGDALPVSRVGQVAGIADRLDTLTSIFGIGQVPSGSSDPFALRRAGNAIVSIVWAYRLPLDVLALLTRATEAFVATFGPSDRTTELLPRLQEFFLQRARSLLEEAGIDYDAIDAVLGVDDADYAERALRELADVRSRAQFLQTIRADGQLDAIYETVNRATRLAAKGSLDTATLDPQQAIAPERFEKTSEREVFDGLVELLPQTQQARDRRDYQLLVDGLKAIAPAVSRFFDGPDSVLVMDETPEVRENRLNLLGLIRNHARVLADCGQIVKSG